MKTVHNSFKSSEEDFRLVTRILCHSCLNNIEQFAAHKAKYTPDFIQAILDRLQEANLIPSLEQRQSEATALRAVLVTANSVCLGNYLTLASYIESSFADDKIASMKRMAGGAYLNEACACHWASAATMNSMVLTFIDTYPDELTKGDMPAGFPDTCASGSKTFTAALETYEHYKLTSEQLTQQKTTAFNGIYTSLKAVMSNGKHIFRNDEAMRKQFAFIAVTEKVAKNRKSGFRITVTDGSTMKPFATAKVQFIQGEWSFDANKKGIIYAEMPEGEYSGTVTAPGYHPVQVKFTATKSVVHREEVSLMPVTETVMAE